MTGHDWLNVVEGAKKSTKGGWFKYGRLGFSSHLRPKVNVDCFKEVVILKDQFSEVSSSASKLVGESTVIVKLMQDRQALVIKAEGLKFSSEAVLWQ